MNIVAPAGNYEKLEAAIKAGANEVYFGLKGLQEETTRTLIYRKYWME